MTVLTKKRILAVLMVLGLVLTCPMHSALAAGGTIDDFATDQAARSLYPIPDYSVLDDPSVIGGERDLEVETTSGGYTEIVSNFLNLGYLQHSQQSFTRGYSIVTWDGDDNDATTRSYLLGANLTVGGADHFLIRVVYTDQAGSNIFLRVYTDANNWSYAAITSIPAIGVDTDYQLYFATDFVAGGSGPANFTNVGAIELEIDGRSVPSLDMDIDVLARGGITAVDLSSFTATPASRAIQVEWETATELDNLGFNLYRSESADGPWAQLNEGLIACQAPGSPLGAVYTFEDRDVRRGATYYYRLEDLDVYGQSTFHGPVNAGLQASRLDLFRPRPQPAQTERNR
jgi:hypothetical protein